MVMSIAQLMYVATVTYNESSRQFPIVHAAYQPLSSVFGNRYFTEPDITVSGGQYKKFILETNASNTSIQAIRVLKRWSPLQTF